MICLLLTGLVIFVLAVLYVSVTESHEREMLRRKETENICWKEGDYEYEQSK